MAILLFLVAIFLAIRSLMSLVLKRRDALHELLVNHLQEVSAQKRKRLQILEFRTRKRKKLEQQAAAANASETPQPPAKVA